VLGVEVEMEVEAVVEIDVEIGGDWAWWCLVVLVGLVWLR
jgi:hypothetical protein